MKPINKIMNFVKGIKNDTYTPKQLQKLKKSDYGAYIVYLVKNHSIGYIYKNNLL
jgi:hypothetical protein